MTVRSHPIDDITTVERPWGRFEQFVTNARATVKVITVEPRQRLSLQRHHERDELWQLIDGRLEVEVDGCSSTLAPGGRLWVARGATHRMGNPGAAPARMLEVAFGEFREDDIERLEDDYQRVVTPV